VFFFQAEDGIRDFHVTGVQTCALPILVSPISTNSEDFLNPDYFGLGLHLRSHMQRKPGRMHWEVVHEGMPFSGTPIATSVSSQGQTAWSDLGLGGVEHKQLIYK